MKRILLLATIGLVAFLSSNAQTADEWLNQNSTQKKYLLQQIAALKVYLGYAKKGYSIVTSGVSTIRNIRNGDLNLHRDFFNRLKNVNPAIRKYAKVADIIAYQVNIIKQTKITIQQIKETKQFTEGELDHCKQVFDNLLNECMKTVEELILVTTSGKLEMKDDERLKRIDRLYADVQDKYSFACSFSEDIGLLAVQRLGEQMEINRSKLINGIK
ncbi:hypothetical protein ACFSQD_04715 [Flavihumibacter stibioxidans]|uniref:TerB family tellurite resistance protein n=1 Tax=Flavihumibacter stibioxidans TaxID=1834163 RepID=A0ABR7M4D6_9BACT|nr:hypothetical protein [Flavihumibacter stibioxidans]MBC6489610.1 hypothetical protein [Flavihumibacter stibioxidans]